MDYGVAESATVAAELRAQPSLACRRALQRVADEYLLIALRIDADTDECAQDRHWDYGDLILLSGSVDGTTAAGWLSGPTGHMLGVGFTVGIQQSSVSHRAHPSRSMAALDAPTWPFVEFQIPIREPAPLSQNFVIGVDCPSFESANAALAHFLYGPTTANISAGGQARIRIVRRSARIAHVRLSATAVVATIDGQDYQGSRAELLAPGHEHQICELTPDGQVEFLLADGLPDRALLMLSRGGTWFDYRHLDPAYRLGRPDFSWDADPSEQIQALITMGESSNLEFKVAVPPSGADARNFVKTVAAFANGHGGSIVFGVDDDDHLPVGIADAAKARDRLCNLVRSNVTPQLAFDVDIVRVHDKELLVLTVTRGDQPPYGVDPKNPRYYVRRAGSTYPAEPHELRAIVQAGTANAAASWLSPTRW